MISIRKKRGQDFVILNLTDTHLVIDEWQSEHDNKRFLKDTITELINKTKPDLITISGDVCWGGDIESYRKFADFIDSFGIFWSPVWGNHDDEEGEDFIESVVTLYEKYDFFLYERGPKELGNGNYVITIMENDKVVEGLIMMDSHNRISYIDQNGESQEVYAKLYPAQIDWYKQQIQELRKMNCEETVMIMHIPFFGYRTAYKAAVCEDVNVESLPMKLALNGERWKEEYRNSVGVQGEEICSYVQEDGVLDAIIEMNSTRFVIVGHDHINNWMINYQGVNLIYGLKTGAGAYWYPKLNGGTVLRVGTEGVIDVHHEYVDLEIIT